MKNYPETKTIRVQFTKEVNEDVEFMIVASNDYGAVYVNMEHKRFHIVGDKVKCLVVLAKDMMVGEPAAIALFAMLYSFAEA